MDVVDVDDDDDDVVDVDVDDDVDVVVDRFGDGVSSVMVVKVAEYESHRT